MYNLIFKIQGSYKNFVPIKQIKKIKKLEICKNKNQAKRQDI